MNRKEYKNYKKAEKNINNKTIYKKKNIGFIVCVTLFISLSLLVLYRASIIMEYKQDIRVLESEIDELKKDEVEYRVEIESSTATDIIESFAINDLNMNYAKRSEIVSKEININRNDYITKIEDKYNKELVRTSTFRDIIDKFKEVIFFQE